MKLSEETLLRLMAYADDELDAAERAEIEALLAKSEEARAVLAGMTGSPVGEWVARSQEERAVAAAADSLAASVMAKVAQEGKPLGDLEEARRRRELRGRVAMGLAAVAALAAGLFLYVRTDNAPTVPAPSGPIASATQPPAQPAPLTSVEPPIDTAVAANAANAEPPEVTVESTTSHDVSVFVIPETAGATANLNTAASVIVWIGDDPPPKGK